MLLKETTSSGEDTESCSGKKGESKDGYNESGFGAEMMTDVSGLRS